MTNDSIQRPTQSRVTRTGNIRPNQTYTLKKPLKKGLSVKNLKVTPMGVTLLATAAFLLLYNSPVSKLMIELSHHDGSSLTTSTGRMTASVEHECIIGWDGANNVGIAKEKMELYLKGEGYSEEKAEAVVETLESFGTLDHIAEGKAIR